jgi:hypothetical protein
MVKSGYNEYLPYISIGQMIQFLDENQISKTVGFRGISRIHSDEWDVNMSTPLDITEGELCDALWEACREILNGEWEELDDPKN